MGIGAQMSTDIPGNELFAIATFAVASIALLSASAVNLKRLPREQWRPLLALALVSGATLALSVAWFWLAVNNWFR